MNFYGKEESKGGSGVGRNTPIGKHGSQQAGTLEPVNRFSVLYRKDEESGPGESASRRRGRQRRGHTPPRLTLGQWLDIWQREYLGSAKPATVRAYDSHIRNHTGLRISELLGLT